MKKIFFCTAIVISIAAAMQGQDPTSQATSQTTAQSASQPSSWPSGDAKYKIVMNFQKGKIYEVTMRNEGERSPRKLTWDIKYYLSIDNVADGKADVKMNIRYMKITKKSGDNEESFDTDNPENANTSKIGNLLAMTQAEISAQMDSLGIVGDLVGQEDMEAKSEELGGDIKQTGSTNSELAASLHDMLATPLTYATADFSDIDQTVEFGRADHAMTHMGSIRKRNDVGEQLNLKLVKVEDTKDGKIAIIDFSGDAFKSGKAGKAIPRTGQFVFNLTKGYFQSVRIETTLENGRELYKTEFQIKPVDKVPPARAITTRPTTRPTSRPANQAVLQPAG